MMQDVARELNVNISQDNDTGYKTLLDTSSHILGQLESGILTLTHEQYAVSTDINISAIGCHVRHIIEFYQTLLKAKENDVICYDERKRNTLLETSQEAALNEIKSTRNILSKLQNEDRTLQIKSIIDPEQPMILMQTSLYRELFYLLDHAIHHMALIKMLAEKENVPLGRDFGLAQSTKAYENTTDQRKC